MCSSETHTHASPPLSRVCQSQVQDSLHPQSEVVQYQHHQLAWAVQLQQDQQMECNNMHGVHLVSNSPVTTWASEVCARLQCCSILMQLLVSACACYWRLHWQLAVCMGEAAVTPCCGPAAGTTVTCQTQHAENREQRTAVSIRQRSCSQPENAAADRQPEGLCRFLHTAVLRQASQQSTAESAETSMPRICLSG